MSARSLSLAARARVAQIIAELIHEPGGAELGRWLGHAKDTAGRRGSDLNAWPLADVLELCERAPLLRDALIDCLLGNAVKSGEAIRAQAALFATLQQAAAVVAEASRDLADGRIDSIEAKRLTPMVRDLRDQLANDVLPALDAFTK